MKVLVYCGLNRGDGFERLINSGKYDIHYGFEANPELFKKLEDRFTQENVKLYNYLLSDTDDDEVDFYIQDANQGQNYYASSIGKITEEYLSNSSNKIDVTKVYKLKTVNLLFFLRKEGIEEIEFLLTDLEGSDLNVLKTLKPMIDAKQIKMIQSEVEPDDKEQKYSHLDNKLTGFKDLLQSHYMIDWCDTQGLIKEWHSIDFRWRLI
jgi:FkbM family methyltransferase